jgi:hypothetical protein
MSEPEEQQTQMGEKSRAALSFFVFLCLAGMATLFFYSGSLLFQIASVLPGLLALLMIYSFFHALFASGTPPTTMKLDATPLRRGQSAGVVIRQTGPVLFESLRANLICERREKPLGKKNTVVTFPCQENFFDSGPCEIPRMDVQEFRATIQVPADAEPSTYGGTLKVLWRVEIWGKVKGRADFMRPFDIEVVE